MLKISQPLRWLVEPHLVAWPVIAAVMLITIWMVTWKTIERDCQQAGAEALQQTKRLMDAYEANTLHVLSQISYTYKLLNYVDFEAQGESTFAALQSSGLLLPNLIFTTRLIDSEGRVVASSKEAAKTKPIDEQMISRLASGQDDFIGMPHDAAHAPDPVLQFSHRIGKDNSTRWYIVEVTMPASFLVSDYDETRLGKRGVLAVLNMSNMFLVKRTGDIVRTGENCSYRDLVSKIEQLPDNAALLDPSWDGVARYTSARTISGYPLAILVALPKEEWLARVNQTMRRDVIQAALASAGVVLVVGFFTWIGYRTTMVRRREQEVEQALAAQAHHQAYHDPLTALPNRAFFAIKLSQHLANTKDFHKSSALLYLDLDGFKGVNDTQGHQSGDELLQQVAKRLTNAARQDDFVARIGGDEFVVLLTRIRDMHEARTVAERIANEVSRPYVLSGGVGHVTASIGVCICPDDGVDEKVIIRRADDAMYFAKRHGKNTVKFYSQIPVKALH